MHWPLMSTTRVGSASLSPPGTTAGVSVAGGRLIAQRGMGPMAVVLRFPIGDDDPSMSQCPERVEVQALVAQPAVERFDERVSPRLAGRDEQHPGSGGGAHSASAAAIISGPLSKRSTFGPAPLSITMRSSSAASPSAVIDRSTSPPSTRGCAHPPPIRS